MLRARARYESPEIETHVRVAEHNDAIYLDLCDGDWRQVEITEECWRVIGSQDSPIRRVIDRAFAAPQPRVLGALQFQNNNERRETFYAFQDLGSEVGRFLSVLNDGAPTATDNFKFLRDVLNETGLMLATLRDLGELLRDLAAEFLTSTFVKMPRNIFNPQANGNGAGGLGGFFNSVLVAAAQMAVDS